MARPDARPGEKAKEQAEARLNEVQLDGNIRILVDGEGDWVDAHQNGHAVVEGFDFMCSTAGTQATCVATLEGHPLYVAQGYGRHVDLFHDGPWVDMVLARADAIRLQRQARTERDAEVKDRALLVAFAPLVAAVPLAGDDAG